MGIVSVEIVYTSPGGILPPQLLASVQDRAILLAVAEAVVVQDKESVARGEKNPDEATALRQILFALIPDLGLRSAPATSAVM